MNPQENRQDNQEDELSFKLKYLEDKLAEKEWNEYITLRDEIIYQTNQMDISKLPKLVPYASVTFDSRPANHQLQWADWAGNQSELDQFTSHLESFIAITSDESYLTDHDKIGRLINNVSAIDHFLSTNGTHALKELRVVIFGQQSTGKSALLDQLLGFNSVSHSAAGQGTICPVHYHVYKSLPPNLQLPPGFNASEGVFFWNATIATATATPITSSDVKSKMMSHMTELLRQNNGQNTASDEELHVAVYNEKAVFQGIIVDLPGWRVINATENDYENKMRVRKISLDTLEDVLRNSHLESVFICVESVTDNPQFTALSIKDITDHFEATSQPGVLKSLLQRTTIVLNKFNDMFSFDAGTNKISWRLEPRVNKDGLKSNLSELLKHISPKYTPKHGVVLVGYDYTKAYVQHYSGSNGEMKYDNDLNDGAKGNIDHKLLSNFKVGLSKVRNIIDDSRKKTIKDLVTKTQQSIAHHQRELHECVGSDANLFKANVYNAVNSGYMRFLDMISYYANGINQGTRRAIEYVRFPYAADKTPQQEIAERFVEVLYRPSQPDLKTVAEELGKSKVAIAGLPLELELQPEVLVDHLVGYLTSDDQELKTARSGKQEVMLLLEISARLLFSVQLMAFDEHRANMAGAGDDAVYNFQRKRGIQNVVISDFQVLSKRIITFLRETLEWFFMNLIDVVLLLERTERNPDDTRLNVLDRDISSLVLRSRLRFGFKVWLEEVINDMEALTRHSNALDPLQVFAVLFSQLQTISNQDHFTNFPTNPPTTAPATNAVKTSVQLFEEVMRSVQTLSGTLFGTGETLHNKHTDDAVIRILFKQVEEYAQNFSQPFIERNNLPDCSIHYAQTFFNSLKARSWSNIIMELMRIVVFFATKERSNDIYKVYLKSRLAGFVFYAVAQPRHQDLFLTDPDNTRAEAGATVKWSKNLIVLPFKDPAVQEEFLSKLYKWEDVNETNRTQTPERKLYHVLRKVASSLPHA